MSSEMNRRQFVTGSVVASTGVATTLATAKGEAAEKAPAPAAPVPQGALPQGKIGNLSISRLLLGGNLLTHYTHSRDLRYVNNLAKHYNTAEKICQTMALAEEHGVNTLVIHNVPSTMQTLVEYRRRGGKMQWITCTAHALAHGDLEKFSREIDELVNYGTNALYISGVEGDRMCGYHKIVYGPEADQRAAEPRFEVLGKALEIAKKHGLPVGIGAHRMGVIADCEKAGLAADFYVKTFHHSNYPSVNLNRDSRWCSQPEELAKLMLTVKKPWIAFKVMAAGAIPPQRAFKYAFHHGADFVLAGMFDFEIADDVRFAKDVLSKLTRRERPWCA